MWGSFCKTNPASWDGLEMSGEQQERRYRRFQLGYPVRLQCSPGGTAIEVETISKNVSLGGLLVRGASRIPPNTVVSFIITIQGERTVRPIYLTGEGEVVRIEDCGTEFWIAVRCKAIITHLEKYLPTA